MHPTEKFREKMIALQFIKNFINKINTNFIFSLPKVRKPFEEINVDEIVSVQPMKGSNENSKTK